MKFLKTVAGAAVSSLWEKVSGNVVVKDTSANVGIGTDDPGSLLHIEDDSAQAVFAVEGQNGAAVSAGIYLIEAGHAIPPAAGSYGGGLEFNGDANRLDIVSYNNAAKTTHLEFDRGDPNVTMTAGNLVIGTAGKGIDFSAQTATTTGTTTAELLDHYEEGTWTAELKGLTSAATTPVTVAGCYTRIGRQVNLTAFFSNVDTSGASGAMAVSGFPFTPPSTQAFRACGPTVTYGLSVPNKNLVAANQGALANCQFYSATDDGGWNAVNITAGSGKYLFLTITYVV